jgi:hypothetical protein
MVSKRPHGRHEARKTAGAVVISALAFSLAGCGSGPTAPTAVPTPTTRRVVVSRGTQTGVPPSTVIGFFVLVVHTQATGILEATVDWTFPTNPVAVAVGQGDCTVLSACTLLVKDTGSEKPKTLDTPAAVPPGTYSLVVANNGTGNEAIVYTITLIE